ncbi:CvpA family protein [Luteolibacter ambystomatis]|uniref:CvpA family protein n=1 Tax=Luteolibacter ambystomatis TaxID=2824561 RepID=A0A975PFN4_9BACT|nr:CvpA family protein [Luteolibacter ambystomatis]QUE52134.1 CvpA family protein [Luteolibacter ambystomatis]
MDFQNFIDSIRNSGVPQLSLGTAALVIFIICAVMAAARGIFRILLGSLTLAAAVYVGLWAWRESPTIAIRYTGKPIPWLDIAWPVAAGLITFIVLRLITNFIAKPFSGGEGSKPSFLGRLLAIPLSLVPASLICAAGIMLVNHVGNLGELRSFADRGNATKRPEWAKISEDLKKTITANIPADWMAKLDELTQDRPRLTLAKLITAKAGNEVPPKAIPVVEGPVLKAIAVDEKRLETLAKDKHYGALLNHPAVNRALNDPKVRQALKEVDL